MKNNPFEGLRSKLGLPDPPPAPEAEKQPAPAGTSHREARDRAPAERREPETLKVGRAVVRYERAGRGGKEATVIEQLGLSQADLAALLKSLKASLGCGGSLEGDSLMLQGDHRKRLPALLTTLGAKKISIG